MTPCSLRNSLSVSGLWLTTLFNIYIYVCIYFIQVAKAAAAAFVRQLWHRACVFECIRLIDRLVALERRRRGRRIGSLHASWTQLQSGISAAISEHSETSLYGEFLRFVLLKQASARRSLTLLMEELMLSRSIWQKLL